MARKKKALSRKAPAQKKAPARKRPAPRERLAAFFRKLYKTPKLMEKFTSGAAGREQVLESADLTLEHRNLLATGCVRDIIMALAGATCVSNCTINVGDQGGGEGDGGGGGEAALLCDHDDCKAFRSAAKKV